jgi:hypothetical protein
LFRFNDKGNPYLGGGVINLKTTKNQFSIQDSIQALIDALGVKKIEETSLTGTTVLRTIASGKEIIAQLSTMDLKAFKLSNS